jgi:PAS domain S-box-containing protein
MRAFHNLSIRQKLTLIIMATSAAALLLACIAFGAYDLITFRQGLVRQLGIQAEIIGANSTAAVTFNDAAAAQEILGALQAERNIEAACIYTRDGQLFARYVRKNGPEAFVPPAVRADGYWFSDDRLGLFRRIVLDGEPAGSVYLQSDLRALRTRMTRYTGIVAVILLSSCLLAWLLSRRLQRVISGPIEHLAETAHAVSESRDYSLRAHKRSQDELGKLIDAFNDMLAQIQARDHALHQAQDELEDRVRARTAELRQEIAQRTRAENALRDSERTLRTMTGAAPDAVIMMDSDGRITFWNDAARRTFGYTAEEMLGDDLHLKLVPQRYHDVFAASLAQFRETGEGPGIGTTSEVVGIKKDGSEFPLELALSAVKLEGTWHAIGIGHDITDRKHAEQELRQAKEAAEEATRAKSLFLASMSHEIRTPMNAVIGMSGLLLDTDLTPTQREYAEIVRSSSDALLTIINDILDFSKVESGKLELFNQAFDLRDCIEEALDVVASKATEKGLNLACRVEVDVPQAIIGDVSRIRQVLVNLLSNAVKFTQAGEVVVTVRTQVVTNASHVLTFSVRDTGIGISPDRSSRLFQPFIQVDASTTRHYGGTGLGLAISKRLVEIMGGTISLEGAVNQGSTFSFTLPAEPCAGSSRPWLLASQPELAGKRVLIVEANGTERDFLAAQLQAWAITPRAVGSAQEALEQIERGWPVDAVLLDISIPNVDGIELARAIRAQRDARQLPLVMLRPIGQHGVATDPGLFTAWLTKPVKLSPLYDTLVSVFAPSPRAPEPRPRARLDADMARQLPLCILLAEDNVVNQKVARRILERMGYRADVAANGIEVLDALRRQPYDVVLMDVQMPEMDGLEATRRICQEWPATRRPRIIAMTAGAMQSDRAECLAAGMDDYIAKPVQPIDLQAALGRCAPHTVDGGDGGPEPEVPQTPA